MKLEVTKRCVAPDKLRAISYLLVESNMSYMLWTSTRFSLRSRDIIGLSVVLRFSYSLGFLPKLVPCVITKGAATLRFSDLSSVTNLLHKRSLLCELLTCFSLQSCMSCMVGNRLNSTIEESENKTILFILNKNWGMKEWEKAKKKNCR